MYVKTIAVLISLLLAILTFGSPLIAQEGTPNPDAVAGATLFDESDYEAAFPFLLRAGYANPADGDNMRRLLVTALRTGNYGYANFANNYLNQFAPEAWDEITAETDAALAADSDDEGAAIVAAWMGVGTPEGQALIDRVFAFDSDSAIGHDLLGFQKFFTGDIEGALASFETALLLAGHGYPHIAADVAWVFAYQAGQPERAIEIITQAIEMEPEFALLYNIRGGFYQQIGDTDAALSDFDQALTLNPADFQSQNARGRVLQELGDFEAAYDEYASVLATFPLSPSAMNGLLYVAIEAHLPIDPLIDARDLVEADSVLTVDTPYTGMMTANRVVRLPITGDPGDYTITVRASDPMTLDPMLLIANGDNIPLALHDDIDSSGAQADGAYNSQITRTAEAGEVYVAYIFHGGAGSEGEFTVTLEPAVS